MKTTRRQYLLDLYKKGGCTLAEKRELWEIIRSSGSEEWLLQEIETELKAASAPFSVILSETETAGVLRQVLSENKVADRRYVVLRRVLSAAAVVLVVAAAGYFLLREPVKQPAAGTVVEVTADIAPGTSKAVLTLADGTTIMLDSTGNQILAQGGTAIRQHGGALQYDASAGGETIGYNILSTPRGGQFHILLPDGTGVWLNTLSSLRYPTAFTGKERRVAVTGEAYFEVAKDAARPFIVQVDDQSELIVLGTSFNVNAYKDEEATKTTLLEGSIKIVKGGRHAILSPGQQAQLGKSGAIQVRETNTARAVAWKHGVFNFENASLPEVMRQLARWYDIEVAFATDAPRIEFVGEISRSTSLKGVLKGLEKTGVRFRLEGRKLTVMP
ncbi:FecR family protein [Chitinophaga cymbidii]|uniref:Iron dicitrate transporter FecR n=1 Tax=Chitinophaga cymbidii TaxID=1096750 RepID=A0A512RN63_9BACT|nr:FecR family protein [Chitinophaga cymbidii]GEP97137.1 hypothetical protein CCY01nite_33970 [Chitinophaga cymbidii]